MAELVAISSVWPSGAAFATAFTPTCWPAPGRFSTTNGSPIRCSQTCAAMRASRSVEPAGVNGTTTVTVLDGQSCGDAEMIEANKTRKGHSSHRGVMSMLRLIWLPATSIRLLFLTSASYYIVEEENGRCASQQLLSALTEMGQEQTSLRHSAMSASPLKANIRSAGQRVHLIAAATGQCLRLGPGFAARAIRIPCSSKNIP